MEEAAAHEHPLVVLEVQEGRLAAVAEQAEALIILATVAGRGPQGH